jgi:hypothetical protein
VITIEGRPLTDACSSCSQPLDWVWRAKDERWYAIVKYDGDPDPTVVKLHACPLPGVPRLWRKLQVQPPEVWERGRRRARAALAAKSNITERKSA